MLFEGEIDDSHPFHRGTDWLITSNYTTLDTPPTAQGNITGMKIAFWVDVLDTGEMTFPANGLRIVMPDGSFLQRQMPNPVINFGGLTAEIQVPAGTNRNDVCNTTSGMSVFDFDFSNPDFGLAFHFLNLQTSQRLPMQFVTAKIDLYWTAPGVPTTTQPETTTPVPGDSFPLGAVIGGVVGGVVVLALVVILIVFLVRRRSMAQPEIKLDAPMHKR